MRANSSQSLSASISFLFVYLDAFKAPPSTAKSTTWWLITLVRQCKLLLPVVTQSLEARSAQPLIANSLYQRQRKIAVHPATTANARA